jgi:hypothetical protein
MSSRMLARRKLATRAVLLCEATYSAVISAKVKKGLLMISRVAPYLVGAVAAVLLTATLATAQSVLLPAQAPAAAPPATAMPGADTPGRGARTGERREGRAAMGACRADMQSLCGTVERGKGNKMRCLIENRAKASADCQTAIAAVASARSGKAAAKAAKRAELGGKRGERGGRMAACRADSKALCADVERGGGRKIACLKANEVKLSADCAATVKSLPNRG